ncbi:MAG: membrane protein of unknown function [Promethearchaeota archaeon]|nr:MAG: membrane protein of unknown function [Candidatus Lokiarchaeota archaeon]
MTESKRDSEEKIQRITDWMWKFWWFCFYLIISPFILSLISYFILSLMKLESAFMLGFCLTIFFFFQGIFYKFFDKYKDKPLFSSNISNFSIKIHFYFLISIFSYLISIVLYFLEGENLSLAYFPLFSFGLLSSLIFYFSYYNPIEYYDESSKNSEGQFFASFGILKPYNMLTFISYIIQLTLLFINPLEPLILYISLSVHITFYLVAFVYTHNLIGEIKKDTRRNVIIPNKGILFKQKYSYLLISEIFVFAFIVLFSPNFQDLLLFFNPEFIVVTNILLGFILFIVLLKTLIGLNYHYFTKTLDSENLYKEKISDRSKNIVKRLNSILSLSLIIIVFISSFLLNAYVFGIVLFVGIFFLSYFENNRDYINPKAVYYVFLANSIGFLALISFGLLPIIIVNLIWNVQIIIFLVSLYLILEIFSKFGIFSKEDTLIFQNIIGVLTFSFFIYLFYPLIIIEYANFTNDWSFILLSNIVLHALIISIISITSFYILFIRHLHDKHNKLFKISLICNFLLIEFLLLFILNFRTYFVNFQIFPSILFFTNFMFSLFFMGFLLLNKFLRIFNESEFRKTSYYAFWYAIATLFLTILSIDFFNFFLLLIGLLTLTVGIQINSFFGANLEVIKKDIYEKIKSYNSFIGLGEFFILSNIVCILFFNLDYLISFYISLVISSVIFNLLSYEDKIFSSKVSQFINIGTLFFTVGLIFYYTFILTIGTFYAFILPFIFSLSAVNIPFYYMKKKGVVEKYNKIFLIISNIGLAVFFSLIPLVIGLEVLKLNGEVNAITILNGTLLIVFMLISMAYLLREQLELSGNLLSLIIKSQISIEIIFAFSAIFYYLYSFLINTTLSFIVPISVTSLFLYVPLAHSYQKKLFNLRKIKYIILINSLLLCLIGVLYPFFFGIEIMGSLINLNFNLILAVSLLFLMMFLKLYENAGHFFEFKIKTIIRIKYLEIVVWILFSFFISFSIISSIFPLPQISVQLLLNGLSFLIFFLMNIYNLNQVRKIRKIKMKEDSESIYFQNIPRILISYQLIIIYGFLISLSIVLMSLISFLINSTLINVWAQTFSFIVISVIIFSIVSPLGDYYLKKYKVIKADVRRLLKNLFIFTFFIGMILLFIEFSWINISTFLFFTEHLSLGILYHLAQGSTLFYLFFRKKTKIFTTTSNWEIYKFFISTGIALIIFLFFDPLISLLLNFIVYLIILPNRGINIIHKSFLYSCLSLIAYIQYIALIIPSISPIIYGINPILFYILLIFASTIQVVGFSMMLNMTKNNRIESFIFITLLSMGIFGFILNYTTILFLYNITISSFVFFVLSGIYLRIIGDEMYKKFIKPGIVIFIFNLISYLSYSWLFTAPTFAMYESILTLCLTASVVGFAVVLIYNDISGLLRKRLFYPIFLLIITTFPTFIFLFVVSVFPFSFSNPFPYIIALNLGIFLFYVFIALYKWEVSWVIWKIGWYAWLLLPLVNFLLIYNAFSFIDIFTTSLTFFNLLELNGSLLISILFSTLFYLPVLYSKIKQYFNYILFGIWAESLILVYWLSQNLFVNISELLIPISFLLFSTVLLLPLLYKLRLWTLTSITWLLLVGINISFFLILFETLGLNITLNISVNILFGGLFLMVYSYFPNMRSYTIMLIFSYFIVLLGIFLSIFNLLYSLLSHILISINFSFIIVAFSLYTSRYLKLDQIIMKKIFSWILIINLSWLFYNSFSLIPGIEFQFLGIFFAIMAFGGSFLVFDRSGFIKTPSKGIPIIIFGLGTSFSLSWLLYIFINISLLIFIASLIAIMSVFLHYLLEDSRYILWFLLPIPPALILLDILLIIEIISNLSFIIWPMFYLSIFLILTNSFKTKFIRRNSSSKNSSYSLFSNSKQLRLSNFVGFILISVYFSLFFTLITPLLYSPLSTSSFELLYLTLEFLILSSILVSFSLLYIKNSDLKLKTIRREIEVNWFLTYLLLIIYFGVSIYLGTFFIEFLNFEFLESTLIALIVLFLFSLLEFYYFNIIPRKSFSAIHLLCFISLSLVLFMYILQLFQGFEIIWLSLTMFLGMQLYSNYFLFTSLSQYSKYSKIGLKNFKTNIQDILLSSIFTIASIYAALFITNYISSIVVDLYALSSLFLFSALFTSIMFTTNRFINPVSTSKIKKIVVIISYLGFQLSFGIFWMILMVNFQLNFILWIALLLIFETIFSFYLKPLLEQLISFQSFFEKNKFNAILVNFLYFELAFLIYSITNLFFSIELSLLFALLTIFILSSLDIYGIRTMSQKFGYISHILSFIGLSIILLVNMIIWLGISLYSMILALLIFTTMQFYTNYSFLKLRIVFAEEKSIRLIKKKNIRESILGAFFYGLLVFMIYLNIEFLEFSLRFFILSSIIFSLMVLDQYLLRFLKNKVLYVKMISFGALTYFAINYMIIIYIQLVPFIPLSVIPLSTLILLFSLAYILKNIYSLTSILTSSFYAKAQKAWWAVFYINLTSWPLFFFTSDSLILYILFLSTCGIFYTLTQLDQKIGLVGENVRTKASNAAIILIGGFTSLIIYEILVIIALTQFSFNFSLSLFTFFIFLGYVIKPFKRHSLLSFIYWVGMFSLLSYIFYSLFSSESLSIVLFALTLLLYPFLFLLEEMKVLFNNFLTIISKIYGKVKVRLKKIKIVTITFLKSHYRSIWISSSIVISVLIFIIANALSMEVISSVLISLSSFGLLYALLPSKKSADPDLRFKGKMIRLVIVWGSILGFLFTFIPLEFLVVSIFIGILILGSILLPYIYHQEKKDKISIKWRFYTLLSLIFVLIIFGVLLYFQITGLLV